jgi:hypothetical protein
VTSERVRRARGARVESRGAFGSGLPRRGARLLLDAPCSSREPGAARFRAAADARRARWRDGYELTLTGPWPAYSFMQDDTWP